MNATAAAILKAEQAHLVRRLRSNPLGPVAGMEALAKLRMATVAPRLEAALLRATRRGLEAHALEAEAELIGMAIAKLEAAVLAAADENLQEADRATA